MPSEADSDNDQDDVAIDDGGDDGDVGEHVIPSSGLSQQRPDRQYSARTRELFKTASAEIAKQLADEEDDLYGSMGEEADEPPPPTAAQAAQVPAAAAPVAPGQGQPPAPAAAPSLDPGILAERERLSADRAAFEQERRAFAEKATAAPLDAFRSRYFENSTAAVSDLLKEVTGVTADNDLRDIVSDLIVDLSANVLGLGIAPDVKAATDSRRAIRALNAHKAEVKRSEEQRAVKERELADREHDRGIISAIGREFETAKSEFPHLAAEDDPGAFVWDVIKARHAATGEQLDWRAAAKLADDSFKRYADTWVAKRRHLITPPPATTGAAAAASTGNGSTRGGGNQGTRRTVTNDMAAAAPARPVPTEPDRPLTNEERRERTKARMREVFRKQQRDGESA